MAVHDVYQHIGLGYQSVRRPDPRIAAQLRAAMGKAATVVNVGAGTGSYEPSDVAVLAVEPSMVMVAQRPGSAAPVIRAVAEALPVADDSFDVATAVMTHHHWTHPVRGFAELRRVSRRQVVLTWDPVVAEREFWFVRDYLPAISERERSLATVNLAARELGPSACVEVVPVPHDCSDGFLVSYWRRPQAYLDKQVRAGISGLALLPQTIVEPAIARLAADLAGGTWQHRYAQLLMEDEFDVGIRLVTSGQQL